MKLLLDYAVNVVIIQISILLFISPFYLWYRIRRRQEEKADFNTHLEQFLDSRQANYLVSAWAFGEAVVWFVIPEFLLLLMIFLRIKKRFDLLIYDIYGTVAGILVAVTLQISQGELLKMPYVQQNMVTQTEIWFRDMGVWGLLHQPFSGVPFKVFNHTMGDFNINLIAYIILAIIVRIGRYGIFFLLLSGIYSVLHGIVRRNYKWLFFAATAIFAVLLYEVYTSFGSGYVIKG